MVEALPSTFAGTIEATAHTSPLTTVPPRYRCLGHSIDAVVSTCDPSSSSGQFNESNPQLLQWKFTEIFFFIRCSARFSWANSTE